MSPSTVSVHAMTLRSQGGEARYLNAEERARFHAALDRVEAAQDRTFLEMIFWTGCRPCEALALTVQSIDLDTGVVAICSAKKRGKQRGCVFRHIPLPPEFLERLDEAHGISIAQAAGAQDLLWCFSRTTGWKRMKAVMNAAGIQGIRASARGLRHTLGVHAALSGVPQSRIKTWLGHSHLATTEIYLDLITPEDRAMMRRVWTGTGGNVPFSPDSLHTAAAPIRITDNEVLRIVNAYCAIGDPGIRRAFLCAIETCAKGAHEQPH